MWHHTPTHTFNPSAQEAEAGESLQDQPRLHSKTASNKQASKQKQTKINQQKYLIKNKSDCVVHTYNPSTGETETKVISTEVKINSRPAWSAE